MDEPEAPSTSGESRPRAQDRETWKAFWAKQGQEWRTEPEIDAERQAELAARRSITPDVAQGIYPFRGMKLKRADIEWLLATHEHGRGPVDYHDQSQRDRAGLDLRGADLSYAQLQNLPLARTIGDVTWRTWDNLTEKQHHMAAMQLQHADLKGAYLEGSSLEYANLEGADLRRCHLEEANLGSTNMQRAYCEQAHLDGARLDGLVLADENHVGPRLVDTHWGDANLAVVDWSQVRILGEEHEARQKEREGKVKDRSAPVAVRAATRVMRASGRCGCAAPRDRRRPYLLPLQRWDAGRRGAQEI